SSRRQPTCRSTCLSPLHVAELASTICFIIFFQGSGDHHDLHSFPTRRSSDLPILWLACRAARHSSRAVNAEHVPVRLEPAGRSRSEEHTSELQSRGHLVCRLLLEKKKNQYKFINAEKRRTLFTSVGC